MSTTKTKEELVRLAWLTELRRQGDRQCTGAYFKGDNKACALGILIEVALPPMEWQLADMDEVPDVGALAGLDEDQSADIVSLNDGVCYRGGIKFEGHKHTFAEIADVVAGWFK